MFVHRVSTAGRVLQSAIDILAKIDRVNSLLPRIAGRVRAAFVLWHCSDLC